MRLFFIDLNRNYATLINQLHHMMSSMKYNSSNHRIDELYVVSVADRGMPGHVENRGAGMIA